MVFVGSIVYIRHECFTGFIGNQYLVARNKQNSPRTALCFTQFVCPALRFIPHEPKKKDTHS